MSNVARQLGTKLKSSGGLLSPTCNGLTPRRGIKGGIAFNRRKSLTVEAQKVRRLAVRRIETPDPFFESPHCAAQVEVARFGHRATINKRERRLKAHFKREGVRSCNHTLSGSSKQRE